VSDLYFEAPEIIQRSALIFHKTGERVRFSRINDKVYVRGKMAVPDKP